MIQEPPIPELRGDTGSNWQRWAWGSAALVLPFVLYSGYLEASRRWWGDGNDSWGLVGVLLVGLACLIRIPWSKNTRMAAAILYVPLMGAGLVFYSFGYVCNHFQACL